MAKNGRHCLRPINLHGKVNYTSRKWVSCNAKRKPQRWVFVFRKCTKPCQGFERKSYVKLYLHLDPKVKQSNQMVIFISCNKVTKIAANIILHSPYHYEMILIRCTDFSGLKLSRSVTRRGQTLWKGAVIKGFCEVKKPLEKPCFFFWTGKRQKKTTLQKPWFYIGIYGRNMYLAKCFVW